ncbi:DUF5994 family protein [Streptomyces ovatisporus]|uniref:DUF5994 family protein n=1 Tax=Streptomyces ovatisporus TaxID=1128682 RepID=A0ABV9AD93_9ACTN
MNVTADRTLLTHEPFAAPLVRLALKPEGPPTGLLDGAWWPHSRNLLRELPTLAAVLDPLWGRVTRISVNPAHWPAVPRKVPVGGHVIKVGWFKDEQDEHELVLLSYRTRRWNLLVIPPGATAATAARLMAAATDPSVRLTASALLAEDHAARTAATGRRVQEEEWESDGGTFRKACVTAPAAPLTAHPGRTRTP